MGLSVASRSPCQWKSVSLRTDEKFVGLYNDVTEARRSYCQGSRVLDRFEDSGFPGLRHVKVIDLYYWEPFQDCVRGVDEVMKRAEKNAFFSEILGGIMLQFEQQVLPALRTFRLYYEGQALFKPKPEVDILMHDKRDFLRELLEGFSECISAGLETAHKVVVSALALLSFVYQYLIGCVDKGGSKMYSPGSFLFRLIFVAIVLFLGSYAWIKSRQASFTANRHKHKSCPPADRASQLGDKSEVPAGVYCRTVKDTRGSTHYKYEPRFKPRREKLESGTSLKFNCLPLGSYDTPREAEIVRNIAAVLYGKEECRPVQFEDGLCLPFPSVTEPENWPPSGKEKAVWVTHKTKQLYAELLEEKVRRERHSVNLSQDLGVIVDDFEARRRDPSPSALGAHSTTIELTGFTPPHGGYGVVEQPTTSESHGLGQEPPLAREGFSAFYSDSDFEHLITSVPQWEENDFPAMDDLDKVVGDYSETDRVFGFESTLVSPQSSALDNPTSAFSASLPELGGGDQGLEGLEIIERQLTSATAITFQQLESLPEQVQLQVRVTCQEKRPEEFGGSNVELQKKLLESEERISELQQKLRQSEVEMKKWRSMCRQWRSMCRQWRSIFRRLDKFISAPDEDGSPVDIQ